MFMHSWRVRERVLNIIEATTGGRVIFGTCKVGGVRRDIDGPAATHMLGELKVVEREIAERTEVPAAARDRQVEIDRRCCARPPERARGFDTVHTA